MTEQTIEAIRSFLNTQREQLEITFGRANIWSSAWDEAWGGREVLRHLDNILQNGTWNGEIFIPNE